MAKFATPVAMKVTEEQGKYLLDKLISMGYEEVYIDIRGYITTNWDNVTITFNKPLHRHIIEEYNPELFLAIAAMTDKEIPIIGEWLKYKSINSLFRVNGYGNFNNYNVGRISKENPNGSGYFLKATLEELTNHFSKPKESFVLPKLWKLEVTKENADAVNKWKTSIKRSVVQKPGHGVNQIGFWASSISGMSSMYTLITTEQFMEHVYKPAFNKLNYKPKTNKNEYKEDSYERESREIKQIDEDLDSISSREGGKEIKIGTVSSRNFCQRGSIESSNSITSPRGSSSRIRAERGRLYI